MLLPSRKACVELGVCANTLRSWAKTGKIDFVLAPSGQRLYDVLSIIKRSSGKQKIVYARVSSKSQKDDLQSQIEFLKTRYPEHRLITDIGSGLNFKRRGLLSLLDAVMSGQVEELVVCHRDRLARFGFDLIDAIASKNNCKIVVLDNARLSPEEELTRDLISIIHVFSCRLYGLRKYGRQVKEDKNLPKG
jgi:predicted site-specific integrase-resolvase